MKILFFIEGPSEKVYLEKICGRAGSFHFISGGNKVDPEGIAQNVIDGIYSKGPDFDYYILLADLDNRLIDQKISFVDYGSSIMAKVNSVLTAFNKQDIISKFFVGVPDKCLEHWIIAGITGNSIDGKDYEFHMNQLLKYKYKKVKDAEKLKNQVKAAKAMASPSFAAFVRGLPPNICGWLDPALAR